MIFLTKFLFSIGLFIILLIVGYVLNALDWFQNKVNKTTKASNSKSSQHVDKEKYITQVRGLIELFGFKLTIPGHLEFIQIDRNPHDMALSFILAAIADDYFRSKVMIRESFAQVFVMGFVKSFMDSGFIHKNAFQLAKDVVDKATDDKLSDDAMLRELRNYNYLIPGDLSTPMVCYIDFKNNEMYKHLNGQFEQKYQEYVASQASVNISR